MNGDGVDDLIVGARGVDSDGRYDVGASYVVFGSSDGFAASVDLGALDGSNGFRIDGIDAYDQSGFSVAGAGDLNGDGFGDLIVGAPGADDDGDYSVGESYVIFGSGEGFAPSIDLAALDGSQGFRLVGIDSGDQSGIAVAGAGDVNGDGLDDLIVGARGADADGVYNAGESYVVFGSTQLGGPNDAPVAADDVLVAATFDRVDLALDHGAGRRSRSRFRRPGDCRHRRRRGGAGRQRHARLGSAGDPRRRDRSPPRRAGRRAGASSPPNSPTSSPTGAAAATPPPSRVDFTNNAIGLA